MASPWLAVSTLVRSPMMPREGIGGELLRDVDGEFLDGLALLTVYLLIDDLRLTHLQFIALATHGLDEHTQVQHTTTRDNPAVGSILVRSHTQCQVLLQFLLRR